MGEEHYRIVRLISRNGYHYYRADYKGLFDWRPVTDSRLFGVSYDSTVTECDGNEYSVTSTRNINFQNL